MPSDKDQKPTEPHTENMVWTRIFYGREVMERIIETISRKEALQQRYIWRYIMRAAMAGFIVMLMYVFTYQVKADLGDTLNLGISKYITALTFSVALVFIYFTNSELLTSNFMYFTVGVYYRKIKTSKAMRVLGLCLFGNMLGIIFIAALVASCSIVSPEMSQHLLHTVDAKTVGSDAWTIFVKGIFANFFINIAIIIAMQLGDDFIAKIFTLLAGVTVFAYMGFEHVVANSALFVLALMLEPSAVDLLHTGKNFVFSLLGNYVGGGLIIGLFYAFLNGDRKFETES
ncbi:MAG: formate/nitrite transporter family protein [Opitutaceae bacterium]